MSSSKPPEPRGTHVLGAHVDIVITTARACRPGTHTPDQADALLAAVLQCIDLVGGVTAAAAPRASAPEKPVIANRTRGTIRQGSPMNPVHRHYGGGQSNRPPGDRDSAYWRHEYERVDTHFDRCDALRRAARYLAGLIARDPAAPTGEYTDADRDEDIRIEGQGWSPRDVARRFGVDQRRVVTARLDRRLHPLTGQPWTPPDHNVFAAVEARVMSTAGMNSTDIGRALDKSPNTIRAWTTKQRHAA